MKKRNKLHTVSVLSAVLMAGAIMNATPAFAYTTPVDTPTTVAGTTTTFDKYLVMKTNANVPNATFKYTVSIPTDDEMKEANLPNLEDTNGTNLTVRKGILGTNDKGEAVAPTASDTKFTAGDPTFDSKQSVRTSTASKGESYNTAQEDQVELKSGEKYAKQTSTVDFSKVKFSEPGVYRYKITENDTTEKGIKKDSTTRYLDVYVESENHGIMSIQGYVFHTANEAQPKGSKDESGKDILGSNNPEGKNKGFTNRYATSDIILVKNVTGNQGYRDQYFKFHVDVTDLDADAKMFITDGGGNRNVYKADDTVAYEYNKDTGTRKTGQKRFVATEGKGSFANVSAPEGTKATDAASMSGLALTANDSGEASFDVYLKHGETVKLNGLTEGAKYTIKETSEDYSATAEKFVGETDKGETIKLKHEAADHSDTTPENVLSTSNEGVAFINNREGTLPTGIYHNNRAAFNIMGIAAAGGAIAIVIRKRRKNVEQAQKNLNK